MRRLWLRFTRRGREARREADEMILETIIGSYPAERRATPEWPRHVARLLADYMDDTGRGR